MVSIFTLLTSRIVASPWFHAVSNFASSCCMEVCISSSIAISLRAAMIPIIVCEARTRSLISAADVSASCARARAEMAFRRAPYVPGQSISWLIPALQRFSPSPERHKRSNSTSGLESVFSSFRASSSLSIRSLSAWRVGEFATTLSTNVSNSAPVADSAIAHSPRVGIIYLSFFIKVVFRVVVIYFRLAFAARRLSRRLVI